MQKEGSCIDVGRFPPSLHDLMINFELSVFRVGTDANSSPPDSSYVHLAVYDSRHQSFNSTIDINLHRRPTHAWHQIPHWRLSAAHENLHA